MIDFGPADASGGFVRDLDLATAVATVAYTSRHVRYLREMFLFGA